MYPGERFNGWSHLAALLLSLAGTVVLLRHAGQHASGPVAIGVALFGLSTVLLYAASVLFHSSRGRARARWQRVDHAAIYLAIAGTYTPFALATASGWPGHLLLGLVWLAALAGAWRELSAQRQPLLWLYVAMGWLCVLGAVSMAPRLGQVSTWWLVAGAGFYTAGTVFYRNRRGWRHAHGVWHLFVLAGTASHYVALAYGLGMLPA